MSRRIGTNCCGSPRRSAPAPSLLRQCCAACPPIRDRTDWPSHYASWAASNAPFSCSTGCATSTCAGAPGGPQQRRNALARALFFNQLGELRDRRFENQTYRASGLNLLVAAIILWNTRYLEMALADIGTADEIARHIAPLGWEHISLTGDYSWNVEDQPDPDALRPLRAVNSLLAA
jgi:hypothetical protein